MVGRMMLDEKTLKNLIGFGDGEGVLSFYVGFTPERAADPQPTAPIEIRNQIRALRQRLKDEDPDRARSVESRLDELGDDLDGLLDPKAHGRGRALFVSVAEGRRESVSLQIPFRERVVYDDRAFVRPLVAAQDEGRPAGIVVAHRGGVRLLEWAIGEATELLRRDFEVGDAQLADIKSGPSADNPAHQQEGLVNRERFEDRLDENRHRFFKSAIDDVVLAADERGWDRIVVAGAPKVRDEVRAALPNDGREVLVAEHTWEEARPHEIAAHAWPLLRSVHRQRERDLVARARERTLSGGAGALGLDDTLGALNEGRVAHLLFQSDLELSGFVASDGSLHASDEGPAAAAGYELRRDPLFVERMVEKAFTMGGQVTPVDEDAAADIGADAGGVAALLRW